MGAEFNCLECGACCRTFPVFASRGDAGREPRIRSCGLELPEHLQSEKYVFRLFPLPFLEHCGFLQADLTCSIYGTRPGVCRDLEVGGNQCLEARKRLGIAREGTR